MPPVLFRHYVPRINILTSDNMSSWRRHLHCLACAPCVVPAIPSGTDPPLGMEVSDTLRASQTNGFASALKNFAYVINPVRIVLYRNERLMTHVLQVTFAVHGPYASWGYIKTISASIPAQRKLKDHIKREFAHFCRWKSHTTPKHEKEAISDTASRSER